jgi:hypothetical protein
MSLRPFLCNFRQPKIHKKLRKHTSEKYMSVCLTSESVQQKKTLDSSKKLKNLLIYFWSTSWQTTSWLLLFLPIVLPCPMAMFSWLLLSGWKMIGLAKCSSMAFRSVAPLGPVATFTPTRLPLRSFPLLHELRTPLATMMATATATAKQRQQQQRQQR